jgi:hypothetical protein
MRRTSTRCNAIFRAPAQAGLQRGAAETLQEQRELLHDVFAEVLEDFALAEAIREGQTSKAATRDEVNRILRGRR